MTLNAHSSQHHFVTSSPVPVDLTYILIATAILVLPAILTRLFSGDSGDTQKVLGAYTPARKPDSKPGRGASLRERVHALVAQRRITEAVKLVQSAGSIPLEKAQEIVATIQRADAAQAGKRTTLRSRQH